MTSRLPSISFERASIIGDIILWARVRSSIVYTFDQQQFCHRIECKSPRLAFSISFSPLSSSKISLLFLRHLSRRSPRGRRTWPRLAQRPCPGRCGPHTAVSGRSCYTRHPVDRGRHPAFLLGYAALPDNEEAGLRVVEGVHEAPSHPDPRSRSLPRAPQPPHCRSPILCRRLSVHHAEVHLGQQRILGHAHGEVVRALGVAPGGRQLHTVAGHEVRAT